MSKVANKAEELKDDVKDLAQEAEKEITDVVDDLTNGDEKKPNKIVAGLKKYGIPAVAFGLGWAAKTAWIMLTSPVGDSTPLVGDAAPVVTPDISAN